MKKEEVKITKYELEDADVSCLDTLCQLYNDYMNTADFDSFRDFLRFECHMDDDTAEYLDDVIYTFRQ